jgi:CHAD domain-containing protein
MKKDVLQYYVLERLQLVEENLLAYKKTRRPERLHNLRVEIKKIRAAFAFAKDVYREKFNADPIKPLFKKAGEIRELLINISMLKSKSVAQTKLVNELQKKAKNLRLEFVKQATEYDKEVKKFRAAIDMPDQLPDKGKVKRYFKKAIGKAKTDLEHKNRENLHDLRKRIKTIMYAYHLLPKKLRKEVDVNEDFIDQLQQKTGDWHDTYAAIDFLKNMKIEGADTWIASLRKKEQRQFNALVSLQTAKSNFYN